MAKNDHQNGDRILSGIFYNQGNRVHVCISKKDLTWETESHPKSQIIIPLHQLIAVSPCDCSNSKQSKSFQCYHCRIKPYCTNQSMSGYLPHYTKSLRFYYAVPYGKHSWRLKSEVLRASETENLEEWFNVIQNYLSELNRPKCLLVFINPYGGKKKALKIYEKKVAPLLHIAGIEAQVIVTQRANHAKELIQELNLHKFDGIVSVGGDGMFSEILNSVILKTQNEKGIDVNDMYNTLVSPCLPIGIIPAGSTNAAVKCTTGTIDPITSTLLIIMGDCTSIDICGVYSAGHFLRFAVTFISYGYFGDVICDSEKLRWMGPKRYDFSGMKQIMRRRLYDGELQLQISLPSDRTSWEHERCRINCDTCLKASGTTKNETQNSPQKIKWLTIRGRFIAVNASIMSCSCYLSSKGISPSQHLGNGYCDVIIVSSCSRLNYLRYLLRTSYHHKNPFDLNFVQVYRVREFAFSPYQTEDKTPATTCAGTQENIQELRSSVWDCDGEVISEPTINARIHCQLLNVFGRGFEERHSTNSTFSQCFRFCKKC